jgi:hypothetical protein
MKELEKERAGEGDAKVFSRWAFRGLLSSACFDSFLTVTRLFFFFLGVQT